MPKRPLLLIFVSLLFLYFPIEFGWRLGRGDSLHLGDVIFSVLLPLVVLGGLLRVSKLGWFSFIGFGLVWGFKDLYEYYVSFGASFSLLATHLLIYFVSLAYFINPRIRTLYFDPKKQWWRSRKRSETHCPVLIHTLGEWDYPIMKNISSGGAFLETDLKPPIKKVLEIAIPLPIPLGVSVIRAKAEVRWVSPDDKRPGLGVEFTSLDKPNRLALRSFILKEL